MRPIPESNRRRYRNANTLVALSAFVLLAAAPALALSEIPEEDVEAPPEIIQVPLPPPITVPADGDAVDEDAESGTGEAQEAIPAPEIPEILYDLELLPEPVRRMRQLIVEACEAGDIEALRPLLSQGENDTQISSGSGDVDPIAFLRDISGDGEGHEILAILLEVLEAGFVHMDAGEPGEIYLWPYFFAVPLESLTGSQRVELFKLVTAGDYEDMKGFGAYIFYRVGITPEGRWAFFLAGH